MDLRIAGLRVLVTAGAGGIGLETAGRFRAEGARVHVCDIDAAALDRLGEAEPGIGRSAGDVSRREDAARLVDEAADRLGGLDCVVNNAGIAGPTGPVEAIDPGEWDRTLAVNITGQFNITRCAVPHLAASANASIVNLSSAAGRLGFALRTPYAASKWAVVGFTKSLAIELGPRGIRVNALLPGLVAGPRIDKVIADKAGARGIPLEEMWDAALSQVSLRTTVSPEQVADMALYLASPLGATISGQAISICGDLQSLT